MVKTKIYDDKGRYSGEFDSEGMTKKEEIAYRIYALRMKLLRQKAERRQREEMGRLMRD